MNLTSQRKSVRNHHVTAEVVLVLAIVITMYGLRQSVRTTDAPTPSIAGTVSELDFNAVEKSFKSDLFHGMSRKSVEDRLGPPTQRDVWGPEVTAWEERLDNAGRNPKLPSVRSWDKWTDPKDGRRYVAVLYSGPFLDTVWSSMSGRPNTSP